MCGIYGEWDLAHRPLDLAAVQAATTRLRHRGPDDEGYLIANSRSTRVQACAGPDTTVRGLQPLAGCEVDNPDLAFGFRRLAIVDLTDAGHQPMRSADGRCWMVYNGEVYNHRELRLELTGLGHRFRGDSDTEVVLAAYREWGADCLHRFNGMWALGIWDAEREQLFLARDRFGIKPLHYAYQDGRLRFASEIKALVGAGGLPFRPADAAVYAFLSEGHLPSPVSGDTFFDPVRSLPPGATLTLSRRAGLRVARYYELPTAEPAAGAAAPEVVEEFGRLFRDAVRVRLRADVPVGTCLSGGLDSSSIVCVVDELMAVERDASSAVGERQQTFSAVYEAAGAFNERAFVDVVLGATRAEGNFVLPTVDWLRRDLARLAWHQDEPFGSTSIFSQWCVMEAVRQRGVTVLLDGQGADEILAGYRPYDILAADHLRRGRVGRAVVVGREARRTANVSFAPLMMRAAARQLPTSWLTYLRDQRARAASVAMRADVTAAHGRLPRYSPVNRDLHAHLRELLVETSLPHLLRYEDRNSMAFSVEGRVPFLDVRLVEFALREAFPWCIENGWTKWVLRESMHDTVPPAIAWRRDKVGFETPESSWLRALLADGQFLADDAPIGAYLDLGAARAEVRRSLRSGGDARRLWRWVNVDVWLRTFAAGAMLDDALGTSAASLA